MNRTAVRPTLSPRAADALAALFVDLIRDRPDSEPAAAMVDRKPRGIAPAAKIGGNRP